MQEAHHRFTGGFSATALQSFTEMAVGLGIQGTEHLDNAETKSTKKPQEYGIQATQVQADSLKKQNAALVEDDKKEDLPEFAARLEQLRQKRRNNLPLESEEWAELESREQLVRQLRDGAVSFAEVFDFARCQREDGSTYGARGKCRKGTPAAAEEPALPKRVAKLERLLATGKLPEDKAKRKALYDSAHKRLGVLGSNPLNLKQQNDGHEPERRALRKLLGRLDDEFNPWRQVTEEQMRRAVGTVE
jgi:hypothetical protein